MNNQHKLNAAQEGGIQAPETVARTGNNSRVSGPCGHKAFRVLSAAGIKIFNTDAPTVAATIERTRAGRLTEAKAAGVEGHWA